MENKMVINWYDSLDSTSDELRRQIDKLDNLSVIAAREQTAGRGQRGNRWFSKPGENLTFSFLLKFSPFVLPVPESGLLSFLTSLTVRDFLIGNGVAAVVKWPNDVYCGRKKICGILIENIFEGSYVAASIIGVGINIGQTVFDNVVNATSLKLQTGKDLPVEPALVRFCELLSSRLPLIYSAEGRERMRLDYLNGLFQKDMACHYHDIREGMDFIGTLSDVTPQGRAVLMKEDGSESIYDFKEISYIL